MSDLLTNKHRLFDLLRDGEWHSMHELEHAGGMRYGGRLHELHKEGWEYEKRSLGGNAWEYRLILTSGRQLAMEVG